jgi:hypothetical protein
MMTKMTGPPNRRRITHVGFVLFPFPLLLDELAAGAVSAAAPELILFFRLLSPSTAAVLRGAARARVALAVATLVRARFRGGLISSSELSACSDSESSSVSSSSSSEAGEVFFPFPLPLRSETLSTVSERLL